MDQLSTRCSSSPRDRFAAKLALGTIDTLDRLSILFFLFALGWVAYVGWDIYVEWNRYLDDRGVAVFIGELTLLVLAAMNYLLYGRMFPLLQHAEGGAPRPRVGKDGYRSE